MGLQQSQSAPETAAPASSESTAGPTLDGENSTRVAEMGSANIDGSSSWLAEAAAASGESDPTELTVGAGTGTTTINDPTSSDYDVDAPNLEGAVGQMTDQGSGEFGRLAWDPRMSFESTGPRMSSVTVTVDMVKTMPNWTSISGAPAAEQAEWRRFYAALDTHENGHASRVRSGFAGIAEAMALTTTVAAGQSLWNARVAAVRAANVAYDAETHHGATQGTDIHLPPAPAAPPATPPAT